MLLDIEGYSEKTKTKHVPSRHGDHDYATFQDFPVSSVAEHFTILLPDSSEEFCY